MLAHEMLNKLSVIVGSCDLLGELETLADGARHVTRIREAAESMAERLGTHQCHLASLLRAEEFQKERPMKPII
jgi:hypothetical protein